MGCLPNLLDWGGFTKESKEESPFIPLIVSSTNPLNSTRNTLKGNLPMEKGRSVCTLLINYPIRPTYTLNTDFTETRKESSIVSRNVLYL